MVINILAQYAYKSNVFFSCFFGENRFLSIIYYYFLIKVNFICRLFTRELLKNAQNSQIFHYKNPQKKLLGILTHHGGKFKKSTTVRVYILRLHNMWI